MQVGLTYDLRDDYAAIPHAPQDFLAEFDSEEIIAAIASAIKISGHTPVRIGNAHKLMAYLAGGQTIDIVFNIAEGLWGRAREAQIPAILETSQIPYTFSDPTTLCICQDKALSKQIWQFHGLATPPFSLISHQTFNTATLSAQMLEGPLFVKPLYEGTSKGITHQSIVRTTEQLREQARRLIALYDQPVIVEHYLTGREFTVGILGNGAQAQVLGIIEVIVKGPDEVYGYLQKEECETRVVYNPVELEGLGAEVADLALRAYRAVQCRDAGRVDLRLDEQGRPQLLEINPLPGLDPEYSSLPIIARNAGLDFNQLVGRMLQHAIARYY